MVSGGPTWVTRAAVAPHESGRGIEPVIVKPLAGAIGKVWSKAKPVNGMAALLVMVNINIPVPIAGAMDGPNGLGEKAMVKSGAGTVTVRLIAAAVASGAWLLLRVTAWLVRDPAVVAVT
jgi:hypothetical protein